jgi:hypothetical protein
MERWFRKKNDRVDSGLWFGWMTLPLLLPIATAPPWQWPISLHLTAAPVRKALREFPRAKPSFHYALSRWFQALNNTRRSLEDAVVDLSIAAEAIFILEDERDDKERILRDRMSQYWFKYDKAATKQQVGKFTSHVFSMYDIRSKIVHGIIPRKAQLEKARGVSRCGASRYICRRHARSDATI